MKYLQCIFMGLLLTTSALGSWVVRVGPPAVGGGGSNPLTIPPVNIVDYEFQWISSKHREWSFSISPGFFYGYRTNLDGVYASFGGGLVINRNGVQPGVYSAIGYTRPCKTYCFNVEFKQAIGVLGQLIHPYALRVGVQIQ